MPICDSRGFANLIQVPPELGTTGDASSESAFHDVALCVGRIELQPLAVLVDAALPCSDALLGRLHHASTRLLGALPQCQAEWSGPEWARFLGDLQLDNFGFAGNRLLFNAMGIQVAAEDFCQRAKTLSLDHAKTRPARIDVLARGHQ